MILWNFAFFWKLSKKIIQIFVFVKLQTLLVLSSGREKTGCWAGPTWDGPGRVARMVPARRLPTVLLAPMRYSLPSVLWPPQPFTFTFQCSLFRLPLFSLLPSMLWMFWFFRVPYCCLQVWRVTNRTVLRLFMFKLVLKLYWSDIVSGRLDNCCCIQDKV